MKNEDMEANIRDCVIATIDFLKHPEKGNQTLISNTIKVFYEWFVFQQKELSVDAKEIMSALLSLSDSAQTDILLSEHYETLMDASQEKQRNILYAMVKDFDAYNRNIIGTIADMQSRLQGFVTQYYPEYSQSKDGKVKKIVPFKIKKEGT